MRLIAFIVAICLAAVLSGESSAESRVAMVIGNSAYQHVPKLSNASNDAEAVSSLFKRIGFNVVQLQKDLGGNDLRRVVRDFTDATWDADIAVIYYAGHGIEVGGLNYVVPIDAALRRDIDVEDETVSLDRLLQVTEPAKRLRLVILDACRDNPFAMSMKRTMASRSVGRGLARVEPTTSNTLVAFAAKAGSTAADGTGANSPFTIALLEHLATPGLDVRLAFGRVRDKVLEATANKQEPFVYGSLGGATITLSSLTMDEHHPSSPVADPDAISSRDYEAAAKVGTKEAWDSFLALHPSGFYSDLARSQRERLLRTPSATPAVSNKKDDSNIDASGRPQLKKQKGVSSPASANNGSDISDSQWRKDQRAMAGPMGSSAWCDAHRRWLARTAAAGNMHTIAPTFPALFREKCGG